MARIETRIAILAALLGVFVWFLLSTDTPRAEAPLLSQPVQIPVSDTFVFPQSTVPVVAGPPTSSVVPPTSYPATAAEQQATDAAAQPGEWVTPPAYSKSE